MNVASQCKAGTDKLHVGWTLVKIGVTFDDSCSTWFLRIKRKKIAQSATHSWEYFTTNFEMFQTKRSYARDVKKAAGLTWVQFMFIHHSNIILNQNSIRTRGFAPRASTQRVSITTRVMPRTPPVPSPGAKERRPQADNDDLSIHSRRQERRTQRSITGRPVQYCWPEMT